MYDFVDKVSQLLVRVLLISKQQQKRLAKALKLKRTEGHLSNTFASANQRIFDDGILQFKARILRFYFLLGFFNSPSFIDRGEFFKQTRC